MSRKFERFYLRIIDNQNLTIAVIRYADGSFYDFVTYRSNQLKNYKFICTNQFPRVRTVSNKVSDTTGKIWFMLSKEAKIILCSIIAIYALIFIFFAIYPFSLIMPLIFTASVAIIISLVSLAYHFVVKKDYYFFD